MNIQTIRDKDGLDNLIEKFCPNGVDYKTLGEIAQISRGGSLQKKDFVESGVPCIHYGQIYTRYNLFADKTLSFISEECARKQKMAKQNDIIMAVTSENLDDVCKCVAWLGNEDVAVSGHSAIIRHNQNAKYLTYFFQTEMFASQKRKLAHGTKVIEVTPDRLKIIKLPLPPLPIQQEIVRILDTFTNLTAELTAELTARRKQYEYYRDELLTFGEDVPRMMLKDIAISVSSGKNKEKEQNGNYPLYGSTGVIGRTNIAKYSKEQILVARVGENAGFVHKASGTYDVSDNTIIIEMKDEYNIQYVYYILQKMNLRQYAKGGGQPLITAGELKKIEVPIPSINEQDRIVSILNKFTEIGNSLDSGLPAEITARRHQYEYYRDKLLSFKENHV